MKLFDDLSLAQQERAVEESLRRILAAVTGGGLRFNDLANGNDLQARIDRARVQSEPTLEGWAALVLSTCREELQALARMAARDAVFTEGETVISIEDL
jgi:hypothetical protein